MTTEKAFNLALRYLSRSPKTVMEMKKYLAKKAIAQEEIDIVITRLKELNYLNDYDYARQFIQNRVRFKPKSVFALGYELRQKGIDPTHADELLMALDDTQLAWTAIINKIDRWKHLNEDARKKKLMNHLRYRGFNHGVCLSVLERILKEL